MAMSKFEEVLKKYWEIFQDEKMYFENDVRNWELFQDIPKNDNLEDIITKVSAINDGDIRSYSSVKEMSDHILNLKIDDRLAKGDLTLVDEIAKLGKNPPFLEFASLYCNYHFPKLFPIFSKQHLDIYEKYIRNLKLDYDPDKVNTYPVFCSVLNDFVKRLHLGDKMNYLEMRKFGWLYGDAIIEESSKA